MVGGLGQIADAAAVGHAEPFGNSPWDLKRIADRGERHEDDAIRELLARPRGDMECETTLADPTGTSQGQQANSGIGEQAEDLPGLQPTAQEGRWGNGQTGYTGAACGGHRHRRHFRKALLDAPK